jgi:hypothetical protein
VFHLYKEKNYEKKTHRNLFLFILHNKCACILKSANAFSRKVYFINEIETSSTAPLITLTKSITCGWILIVYFLLEACSFRLSATSQQYFSLRINQRLQPHRACLGRLKNLASRAKPTPWFLGPSIISVGPQVEPMSTCSQIFSNKLVITVI